MTTRKQSRTQTCAPEDARIRLAHARKFLEVADLVSTDDAVPASASVAAALAVLAGIAATDAACCMALGHRSRGQDHQLATSLVQQVKPDGDDASKALRRLLELEDTAHYGLIDVSGQKLKVALRQAAQLVDFASRIVNA